MLLHGACQKTAYCRRMRTWMASGTKPSATMRSGLSATIDSMLGWYAGCTDPRMQLLSTRRVGQVGDRAMMLVLRSWERPVRTIVVGVARLVAVVIFHRFEYEDQREVERVIGHRSRFGWRS